MKITAAENNNSTEKVVYHILPHQLDESEDRAYAAFLHKVFNKAKSEKPSLIILEINTPGGELGATLKIKNTILAASVPTVCFINTNALSAGSLLALSCDRIAMPKGAVIGAATPVFQTAEGMQKAPEKIVSAGRAAWRSAAEANGKDPKIAEAFVDENIVLTKARNGIRKPKGKLLTLTGQEALDIKIADYEAESIQDILDKENITSNFQLIEFKPEFFDKFLAFLTNPIIAGLLMGLGFLAILYELQVPGWGVSGALGLTFISVYFVSLILTGNSGWGAPALFAFGMLLLVLEIFVIPGFGFAGIASLLAILGSIFWSYGISGFREALWVISIASLGIIGGLILVYKALPVIMKRSKNIFLNETLEREAKESAEKFNSFLHQEGVALTTLRPAGTIVIGEENVDVVTQGDYIEQGTKVKVIRVEGTKVTVKRKSDQLKPKTS